MKKCIIHIKPLPLKSLLLLIILPFLMHCDEDQPNPVLPIRYDAPILLKTRVIDYQLRDIRFQLDIAVLKGDNTSDTIKEFTGIPDTSFQFVDYYSYYNNYKDSVLVHHEVEKVEYLDSAVEEPYWNAIMIDQSDSPGSYLYCDYYNQRSQSINAYLNWLKSDSRVILAGFSRNGKLERNILELCNDSFVSKWNPEIGKKLFELTHKTGGSSSLFDAVYQMIDFMAIHTGGTNKCITIFVLNKDDGNSSKTLDDVIDHAKNNHIRLNVMWLIKKNEHVDLTTLRRMSIETGGFLEYVSYVYQLSTTFLTLDRILKNEVRFYRINVHISIGSPNWFADRYSTGIRIVYPEQRYFIWSWVPFILKKP